MGKPADQVALASLAPADQVLKGGDQKEVDKLRGNNQPAGETDERFDPPTGTKDDFSMEDTGVRRSSRQTKNKEPQRFGDPVKHSIKEISKEELS